MLPNADLFRPYCVTNSYRKTYNEGLMDWLTFEGFTQSTLNDKINAANKASFDWLLN